MKNWLRKSLLAQLVSYFSLLSMVTISAVAVGSYFQARASLEEEVVNRLTVAAQLKSYQLDQWVQNQLRDIVLVSQETDLQTAIKTLLLSRPDRAEYVAARQTLADQTARLINIKPNLRNIRITRNSGFVLFASDDAQVENTYRPLGAPATYFTRDRLDIIVPNFYISPQTKKAAITVATPIFDENGEPMAALLADLDLEEVDTLIRENTGLGETAQTYLLGNAKGQPIFISRQEQKELLAADTEASQEVSSEGIDRAINRQNGAGRYENYRGIPVVGVYRWLPQQNLALITEIHQSQAFLPAQQLAWQILMIGFGSSVVLLVAVYLLSRRITSPVLAIASAAERLSTGDLDQTVNVTAQDELGSLARTFNKMAGQLKTSFETLEQRVTERTAELALAKETADAANQAKSDFLANMSHELRTPLNGILGYAQILAHSQLSPQKQRDGVNIIHQCGTHLLGLINDILDLSKIEARKLELLPQPLHLPALLQSVVEICRVRAEDKGLDFIDQASDRLPIGVSADEKRLRQVLLNLLGNAIKFTDRGSVSLTVELVESTFTHSTILFQVKDTGVGITPSDRAKLFEAFEQVGNVRKQAEGTGLGLAISQRIINLMGGVIQVNSELGQGSAFSFALHLPLVKDWAQHQTQVLGREGWLGDRIIGYLGDRRTLLIVDDRWENRAVLLNLLEPLDFKVIEAQNGQEALEHLRETPLDLVITDLIMPIMDGFELIQQIRRDQRLQAYPIVVSSASVSQADQQKALDGGGDCFVAKPVDAKALFRTLSVCLDLEWVYENETIQSAEQTGRKSAADNTLTPPADELKALLAIAHQANPQEICDYINGWDACYQKFAAPLIDLARSFRIEEIEGLLQQHLAQENIN